jgi:hypothetical protein
MSVLLENYDTTIQQQGLNTNKNVVLGGNLTVSGVTTLAGVVQSTITPVASGGATKTILAAQSGDVFLLDQAAGVTYTLPTPTAGLNFTFICTVAVTSNNDIIQTANTGTQFIMGGVNLVVSNSATSKAFFANGTSNSTLTMNGTTSGGIIGTQITYIALSTTVWYINGDVGASGTLVTPIS